MILLMQKSSFIPAINERNKKTQNSSICSCLKTVLNTNLVVKIDLYLVPSLNNIDKNSLTILQVPRSEKDLSQKI